MRPARSPSEWWRYFWYNRPVPDEKTFTREFRQHSFGFALVSTWAAAIVETINAVYGAVHTHHPEPVFGLLQGQFASPVNQAFLESLLLYWPVPLAFSTFTSWSRRYYPWVLVVAYAFYFARLGSQIAGGYRTIDDATVSSIMLIVFCVIFLRIPFKHVFVLAVTATGAIGAIAVASYGKDAFRLLITTTLTLVLSLYTSWRMEERERSAFEKRMRALEAVKEAHRQSQLALDYASEAEEHRALALDAANQAERQQALAVAAAADAERQRALAVEAAADAEAQRKESEQAAVHAQLLHDEISGLYAQRELFIKGLHHDAMQSLHVMGSMVLVLKQKISQDTALKRLCPDIATFELGTKALGKLVSGMYDLVTLGQYSPRYEPVSVNALLDRSEWQFAERARDKGLRFRIKRREDNVCVWTDRAALERILDNLISNAIKYTVRGGILLGTVRVGNMVRVDVCDTGVGIPKEHQEIIFKEFVRLEQPDGRNVPGHGLGLAIVNLLRDKLRDSGFYLEHSSRLGHGSRFSVSMPTTTSLVCPEQKTPEGQLDLSRLYVIVVEDNPLVQSSLGTVLRSAGYDVNDMVRFAASVAELAAVFDRMPHRPPSVVICDYRLGLTETANDVMRLIDHRFAWASPVPVVVYSAEIQPALPQDRPHLRAVVKSNDLSRLLGEMEQAVIEARREVIEPLREEHPARDAELH